MNAERAAWWRAFWQGFCRGYRQGCAIGFPVALFTVLVLR
jgi:hypothetical protein